MDTARRFTQREVNKILQHIPAKTLRWWGTMNLYGWVSESKDGRGVSREYELANLYQIGIVQELSSLNIPVFMINFLVMGPNFRTAPISSYKMRNERGEITEIDEWPLADVVAQMDKLLLISKNPCGFSSQPGKREIVAYGWDSAVVDRLEIGELIQSLLIPMKPEDVDPEILNRYREAMNSGTLNKLSQTDIEAVLPLTRPNKATIIIVDLKLIKKLVDSLVSKVV
jgi:hypothetical protein